MSRAEELAERLIGTCENCNPAEELTTDTEMTAFDALAFECNVCGWWCSTEELNNGGHQNLCDECQADEEPDEDDQ